MLIKALAKYLAMKLEWFGTRNISKEDIAEIERALQAAFDAGIAKASNDGKDKRI